jgi:hypothetical protein
MKRLILLLILSSLACGSLQSDGDSSVDRVAALDRMLTATAIATENNQVPTSAKQATNEIVAVESVVPSDVTNTPSVASSVPLDVTDVSTNTPSDASSESLTGTSIVNSTVNPSLSEITAEATSNVPQSTPTMSYNSSSFATAMALESEIDEEPTATSTSTSTKVPAGVDTPTPTATATPTSTPTPVPVQAKPSSKKGIGVVNNGTFACEDMDKLRASWYHTWDLHPNSNCDGGNFIPRVYSGGSLSNLPRIIQNAKKSGWLVGFTEPNLPWQGNISPADGAEAWHLIEQAADEAGIKLVSPTPNQFEPGHADPLGNQWTWAMVDEYESKYGKKPRFDAMGWNIYQRSPDKIKSYLMDRHEEALARGYNVPIWVLEYGGECWNSHNDKTGNDAVMLEITDWFDQTDWIDRYAWFANRLTGNEGEAEGWQSCTLLDPRTGELTPLGQVYQAK